jgi:hypothetical protein
LIAERRSCEIRYLVVQKFVQCEMVRFLREDADWRLCFSGACAAEPQDATGRRCRKLGSLNAGRSSFPRWPSFIFASAIDGMELLL